MNFEKRVVRSINAVQNVSRFFACVLSLLFLEAKIERVWFSEAKRGLSYKSFYFEKLRVSYFENKRNWVLFKVILTRKYYFDLIRKKFSS